MKLSTASAATIVMAIMTEPLIVQYGFFPSRKISNVLHFGNCKLFFESQM